ncbi:MAG: hypothetical protein K1X78_21425 [Verrucomicrobiaceae bacterium]|nr:hypothetical protein [Verrucomicrobiaceae bacterium]
MPCLPAAATAWLTARLARGSPTGDDWFAVTTLHRALEGINVWPDFFQQRTLHIVPVEAIATHLVYLRLGGDMRWLSALGLVIVALTAWMLCRMAAELLPDSTAGQRMLAGTWITLCLFSPLQSETWLWGLCWTLPVPLAAFCTGWFLAQTHTAVWLRVTGMAFLTATAFLTHSGALAVGPCLVLALLLASDEMIPARRRLLTAWVVTLISLGVVLALRFNFHRVRAAAGESADRAPSVGRMIEGFFALIGHPVALGTGWQCTALSLITGGVITAFIGLLTLRVVLVLRREPRAYAAAPWLAVGAFGFMNAGMLAVTRAARSEWPTYTPRYITLVTPAVLALVVLLAWASRTGLLPGSEHRRKQALVAAGALAFAGILAAWSEGVTWMKLWRTHRLQSEALVAFTGTLPMTKLQSVIHNYHANSIIPPEAKFLQENHALSGTPVFPDAKLSNLRIAKSALPASLAGCTRTTRCADGSLLLDGYADFKSKGRPADLVVLTKRSSQGGEGQVVIAGVVPPCRLDYYRFDPAHLHSSATAAAWTLRVQAADLPADDSALELWAIDILQREARAITPSVDLLTGAPKKPQAEAASLRQASQ